MNLFCDSNLYYLSCYVQLKIMWPGLFLHSDKFSCHLNQTKALFLFPFTAKLLKVSLLTLSHSSFLSFLEHITSRGFSLRATKTALTKVTNDHSILNAVANSNLTFRQQMTQMLTPSFLNAWSPSLPELHPLTCWSSQSP